MASSIVEGEPEPPEQRNAKRDLQAMERAMGEILAHYGLTDTAPDLLEALAEENPDLFFQAALARLERKDGLPIQRKRNLRLLDVPAFLLQLVRSDRFTTSELKGFCAAGIREDPLLDVKLARLLPGRRSDEYHLETSLILRTLDVLDEVSPGPRLLMIVGHLAYHPEHRVASKAALLIGRRLQNRDWVERQLASSDPRIRANVAEALWNVNSALALQTFRRCLGDANNRVYGNALVGLYLRKDPGIGVLIRQLAQDNRPGHRQTAAWVMGKVRDPEFVGLLEGLTSDPDLDVRRSAMSALEKARRKLAPAAIVGLPAVARSLAPPGPGMGTAHYERPGPLEATRPNGPDEGQSSNAPPVQNNGAPSCHLQLNGRYITGD